ncbi:MAG: archaetidylserine decarboxylase [Gammaproteobacteria bacterium]
MARWFVLLQRLLPQRALSELVGWLTRLRAGPLTQLAIRLFIRAFGVDMREAAMPDPRAYASFNAFFTRALQPAARPFASDPAAVVCPADGHVSECGTLDRDRLVQAKGIDYTLLDLFDGDSALAQAFEHGTYCTIYLAPFDYHRVHMPCGGRLEALRYVPGALFSVNAATTTILPRLFCRNERVITVFGDGASRFALVMVGAFNVGSIALTLPRATAFSNRPATTWRAGITHAFSAEPACARGDEYGRFNMGSTVIVIAAPGVMRLDATIAPGRRTRVGEALGWRLPAPPA